MKLKNIFSGLAATLMALCLVGCDEEKDPVIIEGDLPIKTSSLFMVGDATPNGWDNNNPTALVKKSKYIFEYEGELKAGEMKA